jgi:DNA polymerase III delta prime subunit
MSRDDFLWVEKYRPAKVSECVLPTELKETFQTFVDQGNVPNLLLTGTAGVGKTTIARAMLNELDCDSIIINGSMKGNIDTLRTEIQQYASTVSLAGGRKYVILDEADYLNPQSTQPALRNFMEEFSRNCGFILTCNFQNRIIDPLQSRCSVVHFTIPKDEKPKMAAEFFKRVKGILEKENVEYNTQVVAEVIKRYFPDFRKVLNELQRYGSSGTITSGVLSLVSDISISELIDTLKQRKFTDMRNWVAHNVDNDPDTIYRKLYDGANQYVAESSIPKLVLIIADYQYKNAFVADHELNLVACLTEIMLECEFK